MHLSAEHQHSLFFFKNHRSNFGVCVCFVSLFRLIPYLLTFHHSEQLVRTQTQTLSRGNKEILHYFSSNYISVFSCVSVALKIPLSLNNLRGACAFPQPWPMISALPPHGTAPISPRCLSFPPCLSPLVFAPLHHSRRVSGSNRDHGRLSWSLSGTPAWSGRCESSNISLFRGDENFYGGFMKRIRSLYL